VAVILGKLVQSWKQFINYLKHMNKEMGVEDLVLKLMVEKDNELSKNK
jgi:hypothetical protein